MKHATGAVAIALAAALAPPAATAADAPLAISAQIVGFCRFVQPMYHLIFGEIDATDRTTRIRTATMEYECSDGVAGQIQVDGKANGPLTRQLIRPDGADGRLPYKLEWTTAPETSPAASPGMVSSTVIFTGTMLPAHYRAARSAVDYFDTVTITLNP